MNPPTQPHLPEPTPSIGDSTGRGGVIERIFLGPRGLRAGWRLLIFAFVLAALTFASSPLVQAALRRFTPPSAGLTPRFLLFTEGWMVVLIFIATLVMGFIEKRRFGDYGLPWRQAFGKRFWEGSAWGFVALSALLGALLAVHTLSLGNGGLSAGTAVEQGILWCLGFLLVGFFEEFMFRGYALATLADGIGFWPAAVVLSLCFGSVHLGNTGESYVGALMAAAIGFVFCLSLRRTGSLWFAIGLHASWDWAETFFYGVPNSGQVASTHLLSSSSHGPVWLTGGTVGPEGSVLAIMLMVILWFGIGRRFRSIRFPRIAQEV